MDKKTKNKQIKYWKEHNLKNYQLKNSVKLTENEIHHILDWFKSDEADRHVKRIQRVSIPQALLLSKQWVDFLNKKAEIDEDMTGIKTIHEFNNGYKIVQLISKKSFEREGKIMGHCVSSYYSHKNTTILSLRDELNEPHCTIEVNEHWSKNKKTIASFLKKGILANKTKGVIISRQINQIKGKGNGPVVKKYQKYIQDFLKNKCADYDINSFDCNNIGLIKTKDGIISVDEIGRLTELSGEFLGRERIRINDADLSKLPRIINKISMEISNCHNLSELVFDSYNSYGLKINNCDNIKSISINTNTPELVIELCYLPQLEKIIINGCCKNLQLLNCGIKELTLKFEQIRDLVIKDCNKLVNIELDITKIHAINCKDNLNLESIISSKMVDLVKCSNNEKLNLIPMEIKGIELFGKNDLRHLNINGDCLNDISLYSGNYDSINIERKKIIENENEKVNIEIEKTNINILKIDNINVHKFLFGDTTSAFYSKIMDQEPKFEINEINLLNSTVNSMDLFHSVKKISHGSINNLRMEQSSCLMDTVKVDNHFIDFNQIQKQEICKLFYLPPKSFMKFLREITSFSDLDENEKSKEYVNYMFISSFQRIYEIFHEEKRISEQMRYRSISILRHRFLESMSYSLFREIRASQNNGIAYIQFRKGPILRFDRIFNGDVLNSQLYFESSESHLYNDLMNTDDMDEYFNIINFLGRNNIFCS